MTISANIITIASDGGCAPNPGRGGWAFAIFAGSPAEGNELRDVQGEHVKRAGFDLSSTNNLMEIKGLTSALQRLLDEVKAGQVGPCEIVLHLDSQYTLNSFFDWIPGWKRRGWRKADGKPVKNQPEMIGLDALKQEFETRGFSFRKNWVRGHTCDYANELVDQMLTAARNVCLAE